MFKGNLKYISTKIYFSDNLKELMTFNTPNNFQLPLSTPSPSTLDMQRPEKCYKMERLFLYISFLDRIFLP